jgi:Flp pilus assembly protein TadG
MRRRAGGSMLVEMAMWMPIFLLLIVGMLHIGEITYTYYVLKKIEYAAAQFLATQQGLDLCGTDYTTAALNFALNDNTTSTPLIANLTSDMLQVTTQCLDPSTGVPGTCDTSACDTGIGSAQRPDYITVSIPGGYAFNPNIPYIQLPTIELVPSVTVPFGGSAL